MTENEAIKIIGNNATEKEIILETLYQLVEKFNRGHWGDIQLFEDEENRYSTVIEKVIEEIQQYRAIGTVEELKELKDYKKLYDVYRNIGSINEFRNLKNKKNVLPIANITINEEDMQKIVNEKIKEIELDIQKIRAKAIDEFAEEIRDWQIDIQDNEYDADKFDFVFERIFEIAEQMKAGGKNEID